MRTVTSILLGFVLLACEREADRPAQAPMDSLVPDSLPADAAAVTPDTVPTRQRAASPTQFDPQTVKPGDTIGGLTVARVKRPPDDYSVSFTGEVELHGSYRAHFDYPEVKTPCFWVDPESWVKLPRAQGDQRIIWFCFENDAAAIRQLGALGTQSRATIVIKDYRTALDQSDVWDSATLVRVIRKEKI